MPLTLPQTIGPNTSLDADEVQENFDEIAASAVNVAGDTLTGTLVTRAMQPSAASTYDIGTAAAPYATIYADSISGATANDAFGTIVVSGQSNVVADTTSDTLTIVAGAGITITTTPASDTVTLTADGEVQAGTSGVNAKQGGVLYENITTTGNVGTGEDTLWSQAVAANVLATNGDSLRVTVSGNCAANSNAKTIKFKWGSTSLTLVDASAQSANTNWMLTATITRTGATAQIVAIDLRGQSGGTTFVSTASETLSGAVTLTMTGEATSTNDIQRHTALIEYLPSGL